MRVKLTLEVEGLSVDQREEIYGSNEDCFLCRTIKKVLRPELGVCVGGFLSYSIRSEPQQIDCLHYTGEVLFSGQALDYKRRKVSYTKIIESQKNLVVYANIPKKYLKPEVLTGR